jgi:FkbM family methyltransferase
MNTIQIFQKLPRLLRRHRLLRLLACVNGQGYVQKIRVRHDFDAYIDIRDGFARLIPIQNEFETDFFDLADRLLPLQQPVFVDVGGNYGLLSIGLWRQRTGSLRVRVYEPNPYLCKIIRRSLQINKAEVIELVEAAAIYGRGELQLHFDISHSGAGCIRELSGGVAVKSVRLEDDLTQAGIDRVDLLKVDVEGHEGTVFTGLGRFLSKRFVDAVYFEYSPRQIKSAQAKIDPISILIHAGYEVFACSSYAVSELGGPSHQLFPVNPKDAAPLPLKQLFAPPDLVITDLLALTPGRACRLQDEGNRWQ